MLLWWCSLRHSDFGKNPNIVNFSDNHCTMRRADGSLSSTMWVQLRKFTLHCLKIRCTRVSHMVLYSASQMSVVRQYFLAPTRCPLKWPHHVSKRVTQEDGMGEGRDDWRDGLEILWTTPQAFCRKSVDFHRSIIGKIQTSPSIDGNLLHNSGQHAILENSRQAFPTFSCGVTPTSENVRGRENYLGKFIISLSGCKEHISKYVSAVFRRAATSAISRHFGWRPMGKSLAGLLPTLDRYRYGQKLLLGS